MLGHPVDVISAGAVAPAPAADPVLTGYAAVLAEVLAVEAVDPDAHLFDDLGADSMVMARFCARVRKQTGLPAVSIKDVYAHPTMRSLAQALAPAATSAPVQDGLVAVLAEVLQVDSVDPDAHVFDDLGADSMVMARFCARVRKHPDLPAVSIKDVYAHPTIAGLATAVRTTAAPAVTDATAPARAAEEPWQPSTAQYVLTGVLQLLVFLAYTFVISAVGMAGFDYVSEGSGPLDDYLRAVLFAGALFVAMCVFPIAAKWVLVGRWKAQEIPVWTLRYVRFWAVKTLIRANPLVLFFVGSPLFSMYLRALGAKVGSGVVVMTRSVPVATDLLTIGDGTVVRKDAVMPGYQAYAGRILIGPVTIGAHAVVGEASVLDIDTAMGDSAQLGHRSALHRGQVVPAGERWHGSPAERTGVDYRLVEPAPCGPLRRAVYSGLQLLNVLFVTLPASLAGLVVVFLMFPEIRALLDPGPLALAEPAFYLHAVEFSVVVYFGGWLLGLLVVYTVPRLLHRLLEPGRIYPLYGFHYSVHRAIGRMTNVRRLTHLLGDSSYIVPYLQGLGYTFPRLVQTGSNFGLTVKHDNPYLTTIGSGTMVADGLSVINADVSSTSFRPMHTTLGGHSFLGNAVTYPSQARIGENCLLGTKVQVPIDGELREGVGLLGSPAFEIPRTVRRDTTFADRDSGAELATRLGAKNRYNLRTIGLVLLVGWARFLGLSLIGLAVVELHHGLGMWTIVVASLLSLLFTLSVGVLVEWAMAGFRPLTPRFVSIYDPYFWWHERYWKFHVNPAIFNGTPFRNVLNRLLGVRVGRRVFDDGSGIPERTLTSIGDDCTVNGGVILQPHSQEDGAFKSDHIRIGDRCTIGVAAWIHYGVVLGDDSVVGTDSFLMKGEEVPAGEYWAGNPARELPIPTPVRPPAVAALPPDDGHHSLEELMAAFREDAASGGVDPLATIPVPRRSGRHRAHGRHLAGTR